MNKTLWRIVLGGFCAVFGNDLHLVTVLKSRQNDPCRNDAEDGDSEVETNADEVVCATLGLHTASKLAKNVSQASLQRVTYAQATV